MFILLKRNENIIKHYFRNAGDSVLSLHPHVHTKPLRREPKLEACLSFFQRKREEKSESMEFSYLH